MASYPTFPTSFAQDGWYTTTFVASRLGLSIRTVQNWCQTGFLIRRGCKVILVRSRRLYSSHKSRRGEYWIQLPKVRIDAMLSKVPLKPIDNLPMSTLLSERNGRTIPRSGTPSLC